MADFVIRSQQNIHENAQWYGAGYSPEHSWQTSKWTITRTAITPMVGKPTLGECTFTVTFRSNNTEDPANQRNSGYNYAIDYQIYIGGALRGTARLVSRTQYINKNTTYVRDVKCTNIPLGTATTLPAYIRTVNDRPSSTALLFDSRNQGGDTLTGIPLGIQRSSFASFNGFTLTDEAQTLLAKVTRVSAGTEHDVTLSIGGHTIATWEGVGNFTQLALTQAQARVALNRIKTSITATATLTVKTLYEGTVYHTQSRTATATVGITPSVGSVSISDSSGALADIGALVQNISNITLTISGAVVGYGATVDSYGHNWSTLSRWTESATEHAGVIASSGVITYTGRVKNSRSQVASKSTSATVLPWSAPRSTGVTAERCLSDGTVDPTGAYVRLRGLHSVSPLEVGGVAKNTLRVQVRYRTANVGSWTNLLNKTYPAGTSSTNEEHILGGGALSPAISYDLEVRCYDRYSSSYYTTIIPTESVLMAWVGNKRVGFGKIPERGIVDAYGDVYIDGDLDVTGDLEVAGQLISNLVSRIETLEANIGLLPTFNPNLRRLAASGVFLYVQVEVDGDIVTKQIRYDS